MMLLAIKNENRGNGDYRTFGDASNNQHVFQWSETHGAYVYEPKSQQESDDIISTNWICLSHPWRVAPIWDGQPLENGAAAPATNAAAVSTSRIPPFVQKDIYAQYPVRDLMDLCADAGFTPDGDVTKADNLRLQLNRYYDGRAWAVEDMKRLRERLKELEAAQKVTAPAAPAVATKTPAKRGRPAKIKAREVEYA